jgi:hypothetical protein
MNAQHTGTRGDSNGAQNPYTKFASHHLRQLLLLTHVSYSVHTAGLINRYSCLNTVIKESKISAATLIYMQVMRRM